jgi:hypothetical protein
MTIDQVEAQENLLVRFLPGEHKDALTDDDWRRRPSADRDLPLLAKRLRPSVGRLDAMNDSIAIRPAPLRPIGGKRRGCGQ